MRIPLTTPLSKIAFIVPAILLAGFYSWWCGKEWLAQHFAQRLTLSSLSKAESLSPDDAEYQFLLGRYYSIALQSPEQALPKYLSGVSLNPHRAEYWFSLAGAYQLLGNAVAQEYALQHAIHVDPTTPNVAWEAANFYLAKGDVDQALKEFRVVLSSASYRKFDALRLCWQVRPDPVFLSRQILPADPEVYFQLLEYLVSINDGENAFRVWNQVALLNQPLEQRQVLDYMRYLISHRDVEKAQIVWKQAGNLASLGPYQPSANNLIVNGDLSLDILNGGFGWQYDSTPGVTLSLDPSEAHSGHRSLLIAYDSTGLSDSGIHQAIPVKPNTRYEFSSNFKALDVEGAGGPQFVIEDAASDAVLFATDDLKDADFWKQTGGAFTTGTGTNLLMLRIRRAPAGSPIRGKLWIDGVILKPVSVASVPAK
jgi:hypothetical protein